MAENADGQERSEDPTQKRLDDSRKKGQIPRSREFNSMIMLVSAALSMLLMGDDLMRDFSALMTDGLTLDRKMIFDRFGVISGLSKMLGEGGMMLVPFFIVSVVAAIASSLVIGGWSFSMEAMSPKLSKMNPWSGLKRMFAVRGLVELIKSILKLVLIGTVAVLMMNKLSTNMLNLGYQEPAAAMGHAGELLTWVFLVLSLVLIVVAAIDIPYQLYDHAQQMKMTKQEVRDEYKETEGKPEVKNRVRQMQREIAQRRMMEAIPDADVIITNPTHYAVALKYDGAGMRAPRVVAKGRDLVATAIRNKAIEHEVTIFSAPPLARAIFFSTEIDQEIPAGLYFAVAQVLAYIYQLKASRSGTSAHTPQAPSDLTVPDDLAVAPDDLDDPTLH